MSAASRLWARVDRSSTCWLWQGPTTGGYGRLRGDDGRKVAAHRLAYELLVGEVPDGLELDHLCRDTRCVNPAHLDPVAHRVNVLRGMAPAAVQVRREVCARGHRIEGENLYVVPNGKRAGGRRCRTCLLAANRESTRRYRERAILCTCGHAFSSHRQDPVDPWVSERCKTCGCAGFLNPKEEAMQSSDPDDWHVTPREVERYRREHQGG